MKMLFAAAAATLVAAPAFAQESPKALQEAFAAAVNAEDADALAALYAADAISYDVSGDVYQGRDAIAAGWKAFFDAYDDFSITLDQQGEKSKGDFASAWGLWTLTATPAEGGDPVVMKGRFTDVSIKTKDGWKYVNDHASMAPAADAESDAQ